MDVFGQNVIKKKLLQMCPGDRKLVDDDDDPADVRAFRFCLRLSMNGWFPLQ
jgi:hypothetical protein